MGQLILQLTGTLVPLVMQIIDDHKRETGADPTSEEVVARLNANVEKYLGEGAAWTAAHPKF